MSDPEVPVESAMAHNQQPSDDISYQPLHDDENSYPLHQTIRPVASSQSIPPLSPQPSFSHQLSPQPSFSHQLSPQASFHTPPQAPVDLEDVNALPQGAAMGQPRFLGAALYQDGGAGFNPRDSYASSHQTMPSHGGSDYNDSVYALQPPSAAPYRDDPRASGSGFFVGDDTAAAPPSRFLEEKRDAYAPKKSRRPWILAGIAALLVIIIAVVVALYFTVIRKPGSSGSASTNPDGSPASPTGSSKPGTVAAVSGGDGSTVTMDDGTTFAYVNKFGGTWYWDKNDPLNAGAQAQSWTPALNTTFRWGIDRVRGVNLGGWLVTEPFIAPALYEKYANNSVPPIDEWTLSQAMAKDTASGGLNQLEDHYKTFITESDFAQIAGAGLNWVRIPIAWWAIETRDDEPFLAKTSWTYFLKAIQWARKYGLRINLDLHALPGSQNGWNHSGRLGTVNVLNGPMGYANAQRALDYIRIIAEFISEGGYSDVVALFGVTNEPAGSTIGIDVLSSYYAEAYNLVRTASGTGIGQGPMISYHNGFLSNDKWAGVFPNFDRVSLDWHPYICFGGQSSAPMSTYANTPCSDWGQGANDSMGAFGMTLAGEFSNAVTDCGLWVNGVGQGIRYEGTYAGYSNSVGSCDKWTDWQNYSAGTKKDMMNFAMASMDALQNYFFWTWKIGNSSVTGKVESPAWSYQLGLQNGWMPTDPRKADGTCGNSDPWTPPLKAWQTGGAGAGNIAASVSSGLSWPPATIANGGPVSSLPQYTPTGAVPTLPVPTFTTTSGKATGTASVGSGWANSADNAGLVVSASGCSYLDPWVGPTANPPPVCSSGARGGGGAGQRREAKPTPAPRR